jgi:hypothetical protein
MVYLQVMLTLYTVFTIYQFNRVVNKAGSLLPANPFAGWGKWFIVGGAIWLGVTLLKK